MLILKGIAVLLAIVSSIKSYLDYRKKREPLIMFLFWLVLWVTATSVILYPSIIDRIAAITRDTTITIGSLTAMAFVFMLYIVYRVYTKAARIEYQQMQLIRKIGLTKEFPRAVDKVAKSALKASKKSTRKL
jgi:hypothetical protein